MTPSKNRPQPPSTAQAVMETPLGLVFLYFSAHGLKKLAFAERQDFAEGVDIGHTPETRALPEGVLKAWHQQVAQALEDYFGGRPAPFEDLPLDLKGTAFQLRVWQEIRKIPAGATLSYRDLARRLGRPQAARAVGQAVGANPIPIIVPCHRVIAAHGGLGGYSSGLERKRWLLKWEGERAKREKGEKG